MFFCIEWGAEVAKWSGKCPVSARSHAPAWERWMDERSCVKKE